MAVTHLGDFNQTVFMKAHSKLSGFEADIVKRDGACTVFSIYLIKLALHGTALEQVTTLFEQNIDAIIAVQALGQKTHDGKVSGYDNVLAAVGGLKRDPAFPDFLVKSVGMLDGPPAKNHCFIQVFTTQFKAFGKNDAAHTIAHMRGNDDFIYVFDPNLGLWKVPQGEWQRWVLEGLMNKYNIATGSKWLGIVKK